MTDIAPTLDTPTIHPTYVKHLCMALRQEGADINALLQAAGLGDWRSFAASDALLSQRAVNAAIQQALQISGRPWLALEVGAAVQVSAHGPLGYAVAASQDLRQALQTVARHVAIRNAVLRFHLRETQAGAVFEMTQRFAMEQGQTFVETLMFSLLLRLMETVVGHALPAQVKIDIPFAEPAWSDHIRQLFRGPIRFGAARLAFHLERELLERPCLTADAVAYQQICRECEKLGSQTAHASIAQRVQQLLAGREGSYPSLGAAAAFFSMSSRTLIRRLKDEGTSFQNLLDAARQQRAMWYLKETQFTVEDIAARLGYVDTTNFSRTFRRWYGMTPSDVRKA